jgi:hypothetical protein
MVVFLIFIVRNKYRLFFFFSVLIKFSDPHAVPCSTKKFFCMRENIFVF